MKTKSFHTYLKKRLDKDEIIKIKDQAQREIHIFKSMQESIANMISAYMKKNNVGFNELARTLDASPSQIAKMKRGEANLRLSTLAHLFALIEAEPKELFKK